MLEHPAADGLFAWLLTREKMPPGFTEAVGSMSRQPGAVRLRAYVEYYRSGAAAASELLLHGGLRRKGISGWLPNALVHLADGSAVAVDILFPAIKLVVEIDGYAFHGTRQAFEADRERDRRLLRSGYKVMRFTWRDLTERLDSVTSEIAHHLR
jgi:hypothetical protein